MLKNKLKHKIILASKSPRRQELLKGLNIDFEIRLKDIDEIYPSHLSEAQIPVYLAELKASAYENDLKNDELLITSDTIVCLKGKVMEKPKNATEAKEMLSQLSANTHKVYSAVCLKSRDKQISFYDQTSVRFKPLSTDEIDYYVDHYQPYDKAGAYGVQEWIGYIAIEEMKGSYYTVMGLPMHLLYKELMKF